jgi:hypothetical protein
LNFLRILWDGPPLYRAQSPWNPAETVLLALLTIFLSVLASITLLVLLGGAKGQTAEIALSDAKAVWLQLVMQLVAVLLLLRFAGGRGADPANVLALEPAPGHPAIYLVLPVAMWIAFIPLDLVSISAAPDQFREDMRALDGIMKSVGILPTLLFTLIGAPLAEEMLFRGFLFAGLARSRMGPFGAAVVSSLLWAAIHRYSPVGTASIFLQGLGASYLLWRTGSLYLCIGWHAFNNLMAIVLLYLGWLPVAESAP